MLEILLRGAILLGVALVVDRALLAAERRGWIYYRKIRPVRGVSMHHLNELSQMLGGPGLPEVREEVRQDEAGDPRTTREAEGSE